MCGSISEVSALFLISMFICLLISNYLDYSGFGLNLKIRQSKTSKFSSIFIGPWHFHTHFRDRLVCQFLFSKSTGILIEVVLNL